MGFPPSLKSSKNALQPDETLFYRRVMYVIVIVLCMLLPCYLHYYHRVMYVILLPCYAYQYRALCIILLPIPYPTV
jgi:hypothetical protein